MNVMITAHSGCDDLAMNSEEYILHALTLGVDALEVDVRRSSEGALILTHNPPEPGQVYITLERAFSIVRDSAVKVNCDLKERGLEREVLDLAETCGVERERIIFTGTLTDWREKLEGCNVWVNPEEICADYYAGKHDPEKMMALAADYGYSVINMDYNFVDERVIETAQAHGLKLSVWTIDEPHEIIHSSQIINITTNYPSRIFTALQD